jgi:pimeloyl-ACP methyl ester carboxylesterase
MIQMLGAVELARPSAHKLGRAAAAHGRELGAMAAIAAIAPLAQASRSLEQAAHARLPIADRVAPTGQPVLLVHGFAGTTSCWIALTRVLRDQGMTVDTFNYLPFGTSVEDLAGRLAVKVAGLLSETGADKVHLVGHSLGAVVIAQAFADGCLAGQVDTVVTLAAPFGGSPWATLLPLATTVRALRGGSPLLRRLASSPIPNGVRWISLIAGLDVIVPGRRSVPSRAGVQTVTVDDVGHVGLLMSRPAIGRIVDALPIRERAVA